jgi:hypothetical protein
MSLAEDVSGGSNVGCGEEGEGAHDIRTKGGRRGTNMSCARHFFDSSLSSSESP